MALGRRNPHDQRRTALHGDSGAEHLGLSQRRQPAASRRFAGNVARTLAHSCRVWETPITSVTNGVHLPSWINGDLADLYDQYLEPDWRERWNDPEIWKQVNDIPDEELLEVHRRRKRRLIAFIRDRQTASASRRKAAASEAALFRGSARSATRSPSASRAASPPTSAPRCCSAMSTG